MWCLVVITVSLTLSTQSTSGQNLQQLNGLRRLNNIRAFKIIPKQEKSVEHLKDNNDDDNKPRILQRKPHATPRQKFKQRLSASESQYLHEKLMRSFGKKYDKSAAYKRIVNACSEDKKDPGRVYNLNTSPYYWTQPDLCNGNTDLLVAVHTRPTNFANRQLIRNTYGSMKNINGKRVVVAFFLGNPGNLRIQEKISDEAKDNQDIIQRDFRENYRNMTIKHLMIMEWMMEHCSHAKFLVKADDDVFVNIFQVLTYVDTFPPPGFYCSRTFGPKPMRTGGKWKLTYEEYPRKTFPPYCMGYGYVMRGSHAKSLYWCSVFTKFLWIDDVLVGGLLPEKLHLPIQKFLNGHGVSYILPSHASDKVSDYMFLLGSGNAVIPSIFRRIWRAALQYSY